MDPTRSRARGHRPRPTVPRSCPSMLRTLPDQWDLTGETRPCAGCARYGHRRDLSAARAAGGSRARGRPARQRLRADRMLGRCHARAPHRPQRPALGPGADRPAGARTPGSTCSTRRCSRCPSASSASCASVAPASAAVPGRSRHDRPGVRARPVQRQPGRADVPHGRPGALQPRRAARVPRAGRPPGQDPRAAHRARARSRRCCTGRGHPRRTVVVRPGPNGDKSPWATPSPRPTSSGSGRSSSLLLPEAMVPSVVVRLRPSR